MSLNNILQMAQDADTTKSDVIEYVEDLIANRKSTIKYIVTKSDSLAQNVKIASLLVDALDVVVLAMEEQFKKMPVLNPKAITKVKIVRSTNKAFVAFTDGAFEKPKGNAESGVEQYADLADAFQEAMFKWIDEHKVI